MCISCGIRTGKYRRLAFKMGGTSHFACDGCKVPLPREEEEKAHNVEEFVFKSGIGYGREVEVTVNAKGSRWCKRCWLPLKNLLGDDASAVVSMQQVF